MVINDIKNTCNSKLHELLNNSNTRKQINDVLVCEVIRLNEDTNKLSCKLSMLNDQDTVKVWIDNMVNIIIPFINNNN